MSQEKKGKVVISADKIIGILLDREKYRFVDKSLLAEVVRDTEELYVKNSI